MNVAEMYALADGWDGRNSLAPRAQTIENFEATLATLGADEEDTCATSNGCVEIELGNISTAKGYAHFEVGLTRLAGYVTPVEGETTFFNMDVVDWSERQSEVLEALKVIP